VTSVSFGFIALTLALRAEEVKARGVRPLEYLCAVIHVFGPVKNKHFIYFWDIKYIPNTFSAILPRDATQSAVMRQYVVCPSVRQPVSPSVRL